MAQGESRFDPNSRQVQTQEFRTAPTGDYTLKSKKNFRVACKDEEGAIPYTWGNVELLDTQEEGKPESKNVSMLLPFYLTLTPRKEDGKPAVDLAGGLVDLCQKLKLEVPETVKVLTSESGDRGTVEHLSAKGVKDMLNDVAGEFTIRAHVKKIPAKGQWPAKNVVEHFIDDEGNRIG